VNLNYCRRGNIPTATCGGIRRAVVLWTISLFALGMASQTVIAQPQVTGKDLSRNKCIIISSELIHWS
jgi:hypothetical protein